MHKEDITKMYYKGYINYNNKASNSFLFKLIMTAPPEIVHSEIRHDTFVVPGRDGELYSKNTYRGNASIKVSFDIVTTGNVSSYTSAMNQLYKWLKGSGTLIISDETAYYEVKKVIITTDQRTIAKYGHLDVEFVVYPYKFLQSGSTAITSASIENTHDDARPLYYMTRSSTSSAGSATLTVNGNAFTVNFPSGVGAAYIDTRKKACYYESSNTKISITGSGDYDKLILPGGTTSTLSISGANLLTTLPKWGYEI